MPKFELYRPKQVTFDFYDFAETERLIAAAATLPAQLSRDHFAVGEGDWGRMIVVGFRTGMRIGELLALRWPNVHLRASRIHICEATTRGVTDTPKSGKACDLPLSRVALEALKAQRHLRGPYVFCTLDGNQLTREQCLEPLALASKRAGVRPATWHVLRHCLHPI